MLSASLDSELLNLTGNEVILYMWVVLAASMVPSSLTWNSSDVLYGVSHNVLVSHLVHHFSLSLSLMVYILNVLAVSFLSYIFYSIFDAAIY